MKLTTVVIGISYPKSNMSDFKWPYLKLNNIVILIIFYNEFGDKKILSYHVSKTLGNIFFGSDSAVVIIVLQAFYLSKKNKIRIINGLSGFYFFKKKTATHMIKII